MALWLCWALWYNPSELGEAVVALNDLDWHINKVFKLLKQLRRKGNLKIE